MEDNVPENYFGCSLFYWCVVPVDACTPPQSIEPFHHISAHFREMHQQLWVQVSCRSAMTAVQFKDVKVNLSGLHVEEWTYTVWLFGSKGIPKSSLAWCYCDGLELRLAQLRIVFIIDSFVSYFLDCIWSKEVKNIHDNFQTNSESLFC